MNNNQHDQSMSMAAEKAAVKRSLAHESSFRKEKQEILAAMGASPAVLLSPSANPALQRKAGGAYSQRVLLLQQHAVVTPLNDDCGNEEGRQQQQQQVMRMRSQQELLALAAQSTVQSDDIPTALDHSDAEQEQYRADEQRLDNPKQKKLYCMIGGAIACIVIGAAIGVTVGLASNSTSDATSTTASSVQQCTWDPMTACSDGDDGIVIPPCASRSYNKLMATPTIARQVWGDDDAESKCTTGNAAAYYGAIALAVAQTNSNQGVVDDPDTFYALATFYFATHGHVGNSWTRSTNWLEGTTPCTWYGIECFEDSNTVKSIFLPRNNLKGSMPTQLGMLSTLHTLNVERSRLSGTIPTEIGLLSQLHHFSAFDTYLHGTIPTEIEGCQQLEYIDVSSTMLSGTIPTELGALPNLDSLYMAETRLAGSIPIELGNLPKLRHLYLRGMPAITGTIPDASQWGNLTTLEDFTLSGNGLMDPSPFPNYLLEQSLNLDHLRLSDVSIVGPMSATAIGRLTNLERLELKFCDFLSATLPTELGLLTNLRALMLDEDDYHGPLPTELGRLTQLTQLSLSYNELTGTVPTELGALTLLSALQLEENRLSGTIPLDVCAGLLPNLKKFEYDACSRKNKPTCLERDEGCVTTFSLGD